MAMDELAPAGAGRSNSNNNSGGGDGGEDTRPLSPEAEHIAQQQLLQMRAATPQQQHVSSPAAATARQAGAMHLAIVHMISK